jgi:hypothetical protein
MQSSENIPSSPMPWWLNLLLKQGFVVALLCIALYVIYVQLNNSQAKLEKRYEKEMQRVDDEMKTLRMEASECRKENKDKTYQLLVEIKEYIIKKD